MSVLPVHPEGYSWSELEPLMGGAVDAGVSVLVRGHPGIGKSALAASLAEQRGWPVVDIRLAQTDPSELAGVYLPDPSNQWLRLMPPEWVRQACDEPVLVFLDEINAAVTRLHQAAAYQIVLERRVGPHRFHPETRVIAAGNLEDDQALVTRLSSALRNRFAHFVMRVDVADWLAWGRHHIDPAILAYVRQKGADALYSPDDGAFPSPRSWEMASRLMAHVPEAQQRRAVAACVGRPAAEGFFAFRKLNRLVDPRRIVVQGEIPSMLRAEPSFTLATVQTVGEWVCESPQVPDGWLPNLTAFLQAQGLDAEHALLFLRQLAGRPDVFERLKALPDFRAVCARLVDLRVVAL